MANGLIRSEDAQDGVRYVVLDDPETRNALGDELLDQLLAALELARDDDGVRVVVLTSSHQKVFSSGGNLKAFADDNATITKYQGLSRFPRLYQLIGELGKPVICAANGDVLAGAFGLALACDMIVARDSVRFGCPEINVGAFPFMISALIYRSVSRAKANELMFVGDLISAGEARDLGIVNKVVGDEEFDDVVRSFASKVAAKSPLLVRLGKDAINTTRDMGLGEALNVMQAQLALAFTTEDLPEGVQAFWEKREPVWKMR